MTKFLKKFLDAAQIEAALEEVALLARDAGRDVALVGGVALQIYGSDRLTKDVDFVADGIFSGLADESSLSIGGFKGKTFSGTQVDVLIGGEYPSLLDATLRQAVNVDDLPVKVATVEHIMALKLVAGRAKDELDIETMLMLQVPDIEKSEKIIGEHVGRYAVKEFDSIVRQVEWKRERDK